ncbi:MAG TPA: hypothetical protein PK358_05460 [Spirochaetota bacterium]|nr:hypothetical protein [Spirochaetota bacterium]
MKRNLISAAVISFFIIAGTAFAGTGGKDVKLTPPQKKQLNTFFSNFSGVFLETFEKDKITDKVLIRFGVLHNYRNNDKRFAEVGNDYQVKIKASYIDEAVMKYFGRKISKHQPVEDKRIEYRDGWYYLTEATGEEFDFSRVVSLCDNGNNIYTAIVNIYSASSGWTGDIHGNRDEWEKDSPDDIPELISVMKATITKVTEKGKRRYILIDYTKVNGPDCAGIYRLSDTEICDLTITVVKGSSGYNYTINGAGVSSSGKFTFNKDDSKTYIVFNGTRRSGNNEVVTGIWSDGKIIIQNYGNSMNRYVCFKKCDLKFLEFINEAR